MALLQIVELGMFCTLAWRMEITHLRSAPMVHKEQAALPTTGLLVKKPSFILFEFWSSFLSIHHKVWKKPPQCISRRAKTFLHELFINHFFDLLSPKSSQRIVASSNFLIIIIWMGNYSGFSFISLFANWSTLFYRHCTSDSICNRMEAFYKCPECFCKHFFQWTLCWWRRFPMSISECL